MLTKEQQEQMRRSAAMAGVQVGFVDYSGTDKWCWIENDDIVLLSVQQSAASAAAALHRAARARNTARRAA